MTYRSTRSEHTAPFKTAFLEGQAPDGGDYLPAEFPNFSYDVFKDLDFPSRMADILGAYCPDIGREDRLEIVREVTSEVNYPHEVYRAGRLNAYAEDRYLLELDRGPSGFLHDFGNALYFAIAQRLDPEQNFYSLVGPYPEEQRSFDAARRLAKNLGEVSPAIFISTRNSIDPEITTVLDTDHYWYVKGERYRVEAISKAIARYEDAPILKADGTNLTSILAGMILLGSGIADLDQANELKGPIDVVLPILSLSYPLAALYLKSMGFPIRKIILVNSRNHQVTDFIQSGKMSLRRRYLKSEAEEMERVLPGNLERFVFELSGRSIETTRDFLQELKEKRLAVLPKNHVKAWSQHLVACFGSERTAKKIRDDVYHETDYLLDRYTLMCFVGVKHLEHKDDNQQLYLLCGKPWKGFDAEQPDKDKIAEEAGTPVPVWETLEKQRPPYEDFERDFLDELVPESNADSSDDA